MKSTQATIIAVLLTSFAGSAIAQADRPLEQDRVYIGGGPSHNSLGGWGTANGFQLFAGYNFGEVFGVERLDLLVEAGYMDSGDFSRFRFGEERRLSAATGIWTTGGAAYRFNPMWSFFARAGVDFGDDDGVMVGGGAAFHFGGNFELRGEIVERPNITSRQINLVYHF